MPGEPQPQRDAAPQPGPLLVFDTHPIQYRSPVFRVLAREAAPFEVIYFNEAFDGRKWWFHEVGKIPDQPFNVPLKEGFPNQTLGSSQAGWRTTLHSIDRLLRERRPRAVLTYGYYLPEHWMLRWLTAKHAVPLLFVGETFQGGGSLARRLVKEPLRKYFFNGVSRFIAIGNRTGDFYRTLGVAPERIQPAKYCTDVSFFLSPAEKERSTLRRQWRQTVGIPEDAFVLLFVGRLFERKRPLDMVAIHAQLSDLSKVHTVIVGNGPMETNVRHAADSLPRTHFLGFQDQNQLRQVYLGVDLLVVPSEYETWGLVVNEAFAAGTPALITDTCGTAGDLVIPGETGVVVGVGDVAAAAQGVRKLVADPALHRRMASNAREKVVREYTIEQFAHAIQTAAQFTPTTVR